MFTVCVDDSRKLKSKSTVSRTRLLVQFNVKIITVDIVQKKQVKINITHCTNNDHEALVLLSLIQLSIIAFFFTLKEKEIPSSHSFSCKKSTNHYPFHRLCTMLLFNLVIISYFNTTAIIISNDHTL